MTAQTAQEAASEEAASCCTHADVAEAGATAAPRKGQPHDDGRDEAGHDDHEFVHAFDRIEASRIALVAAAVAVWFRVWEPFPAVSVIGIAGLLFGGVADSQGGVREHSRAPHDHGAVDDDRDRRGGGGQFFTALVITVLFWSRRSWST